jgi:hypothetical protein
VSCWFSGTGGLDDGKGLVGGGGGRGVPSRGKFQTRGPDWSHTVKK